MSGKSKHFSSKNISFSTLRSHISLSTFNLCFASRSQDDSRPQNLRQQSLARQIGVLVPRNFHEISLTTLRNRFRDRKNFLLICLVCQSSDKQRAPRVGIGIFDAADNNMLSTDRGAHCAQEPHLFSHKISLNAKSTHGRSEPEDPVNSKNHLLTRKALIDALREKLSLAWEKQCVVVTDGPIGQLKRFISEDGLNLLQKLSGGDCIDVQVTQIARSSDLFMTDSSPSMVHMAHAQGFSVEDGSERGADYASSLVLRLLMHHAAVTTFVR